MDRSERREQRSLDRQARRDAELALKSAKKHKKQQERSIEAPDRIRTAAGWCIIFGVLSLLGGFGRTRDSLTFGGDAHTEIVQQLAGVSSGVAWLAAAVLFAVAAVLKALADILDELREAPE